MYTLFIKESSVYLSASVCLIYFPITPGRILFSAKTSSHPVQAQGMKEQTHSFPPSFKHSAQGLIHGTIFHFNRKTLIFYRNGCVIWEKLYQRNTIINSVYNAKEM